MVHPHTGGRPAWPLPGPFSPAVFGPCSTLCLTTGQQLFCLGMSQSLGGKKAGISPPMTLRHLCDLFWLSPQLCPLAVTLGGRVGFSMVS